jgi:hypothetical protein
MLLLPTVAPTDLQLAFAGYLRAVPKVGGSTIKDYLQRLPTALALHHSNYQSGYRQFTISPEVKAALSNMAVEIPPVRRTMRDPVDLDTVMRISEDDDIPSDTRAAIVVAFYLGFRPINLVSVKRSRATGAQLDRPLKWGDLRVLDITGQRAYEVTVRKEKAATTHSGDYAPKLLMPAEPGMPCPVLALDNLGIRNGMNTDGVLFPRVTDKDLQAALKKHAAPWQTLTPYSLRIGTASQMAAADLPMEFQRRAGNWASNKTADKYVRGSIGTWRRTQKAWAAARAKPSTSSRRPVAQTHGPAPVRPGLIRQFPDKKTDMLLVLHETGKWRGYFYHPETGDRVQRLRAQRPRRLADFEVFKPSEIAYMMQKTQPKEDLVGGQLARDAHWVCARVQAEKPHPDRPALSNITHNMPAAAGVGGR